MDAESLIKLANDPNTARQPPQSQTLLYVALKQCEQPEIALALLERACEFHPSDFWIHYELALLNARLRPPRLETALRHNMAARALAPGRAVTWLNLGINLKVG
jgi:tetratricopeptide (TPR) repeat protein